MKFMVTMLALLCLVLIPSAVLAESLVCNAYPVGEEPTGFRGTINGVAFDNPYSLHASGAALIYDCAGLGPEKWDFKNIRAYNVRGESVGIPFVWPALPGSPAGMRLIQ